MKIYQLDYLFSLEIFLPFPKALRRKMLKSTNGSFPIALRTMSAFGYALIECDWMQKFSGYIYSDIIYLAAKNLFIVTSHSETYSFVLQHVPVVDGGFYLISWRFSIFSLRQHVWIIFLVTVRFFPVSVSKSSVLKIFDSAQNRLLFHVRRARQTFWPHFDLANVKTKQVAVNWKKM